MFHVGNRFSYDLLIASRWKNKYWIPCTNRVNQVFLRMKSDEWMFIAYKNEADRVISLVAHYRKFFAFSWYVSQIRSKFSFSSSVISIIGRRTLSVSKPNFVIAYLIGDGFG